MFNWMVKNVHKKKGFTLIELVVVIAILGILAAVIIPKFAGFQDKARGTQALTDAKQIATAMDSLYAEKNAYPASDGTGTVTLTNVTDLAKVPVDATHIVFSGGNGAFTYAVQEGTKWYIAGRTATATAVDSVKVNTASGTTTAPTAHLTTGY